MKNLWFAFIKVTRKNFYYPISFLATMFSQNVTCHFFCNNSFDVKTIKLNRFYNRKTFLFYISFKLVWLKREIKNIFLINHSWKKILFHNISGAIHSNNISEILILFEYFRNIYSCHRCFRRWMDKIWEKWIETNKSIWNFFETLHDN